jgi:tetratricopeptide (TPR) repeat protein
MQSDPTHAAFEQTIRESVREGRLDEAIAQLTRSGSTPEDATMLAYLCKQRGDYERAVRVLESVPGSDGLDAATLRLRGNALWLAGRMKKALTDLDAAERAATNATEQQSLHADIAVLRDKVEQMGRVDRSLARLDGATVVIAGILLAAVVEAHRRLFSGPRSRSADV